MTPTDDWMRLAEQADEWAGTIHAIPDRDRPANWPALLDAARNLRNQATKAAYPEAYAKGAKP